MLDARSKKIPEWVLTGKEEKKLSKEEKKAYYERLKEYCLNRKLVTTTKGATTIAPKLKKIVEKIALKVCDIFSGGEAEIIVDGLENIPEGAVIFASTHQGLLDNFVWIPQCPKHSVILHGAETSKLLLAAQVDIGLILVTKQKENIENRMHAKFDMMSILLRGGSIFICPETAWNLSPNKLHLPLNYGFLDTAQKVEKPIVPMVIEYTYESSIEKEIITKVHIEYGRPIYVGLEDSLIEKLEEYKECVSTIRWKLIEEKGLFHRADITTEEYINFIKGNLKNLELGKIDINRERGGIQGANDEFYVFHHINDVSWDAWGVLKCTEEAERLKRINRVRGIQ